MWKRKELKKQAKQTVKKNYWTAVVVCFLITILTGEFGTSVKGILNIDEDKVSENNEVSQEQFIMQEQIEKSSIIITPERREKIEEFKNSLNDMQLKTMHLINSNINSMTKSQKYIFKLWDAIGLFMSNQIILGIFLILTSIIAMLYLILLAEPLIVAERKYFIEAKKNEDTKMGVMKEIFKKGNWSNVALIMLIKNIYNTLWFLTIIGGFIKMYEYRMIPYILAENPRIDRKEAFKKSKEMMKGNKWRAFILDISFILWEILSVFTSGLLNIFYVNPYRIATSVELYEKIKQDKKIEIN